MATDYDPSNQRHVSALAEALGRGPLEWTSITAPRRGDAHTLVCRFPDRREITMPTFTASRRDVERFTEGVSAALLADVVAGLG